MFGMEPPWYVYIIVPFRQTILSVLCTMTQNYPTSAKIVFDVLSSDTNITDKLGQYEFRAGQSTPAISIVSPGEDLPATRKVSGLEVVVQDVGEIRYMNYLSGDAPYAKTAWQVFVIAWAPSNGADLQELSLAICGRFLNSEAIQVIATPDGAGALVQNKILIHSHMPIVS